VIARARGEFKFEFAQRDNGALLSLRGRGARPTCSRAAAEVAKHSIREAILTNNTTNCVNLVEAINCCHKNVHSWLKNNT
jgi:hypothetical protein